MKKHLLLILILSLINIGWTWNAGWKDDSPTSLNNLSDVGTVDP